MDTKVTKEQIDKRIKECTYVLIGETTTLCHILLDNGFTVIGQSACVDKDNFNAEYGRQLACEDARRKLWPLFGFALAEDIHRSRMDESARAQAVKRREEKNRPKSAVTWGEPSGGSGSSSEKLSKSELSPAALAAPEVTGSGLCRFAVKSFGEALNHMWRGGKVRRAGWSPDVFLAAKVTAGGSNMLYLGRDGSGDAAPWAASHIALLAMDWESFGV